MATDSTVIPQHITALERANEVRMARAGTKRWIAAVPYSQSKLRVVEVLLNPPDYVRTMTVDDLLCAVRNGGPASSARWRNRCVPAVRPTVRVGDLSASRRAQLAGNIAVTR